MQQCSLLVAHLNLSHFQGLPTLHLDLHARAARRILSQGDSSDSSMGLTTFRRFRLVAALLVRSLRSFGSRWRGRGAIDFLLDPQRCPGGVRQLTIIVRHGARKVRWHYRITGASPVLWVKDIHSFCKFRLEPRLHTSKLLVQLCEDCGFLSSEKRSACRKVSLFSPR